jgi:hypothetical protein
MIPITNGIVRNMKRPIRARLMSPMTHPRIAAAIPGKKNCPIAVTTLRDMQ